MSRYLSDLEIDAFRETAELAYQKGSKLRGTVFEMSGVMARYQHFPVFGTADAENRGSQADVTPANVQNARPMATLDPHESWDYLDRQDQAVTNVDTMKAHGEIHGKAVSRQYDADIIGAAAGPTAGAYSRAGLSSISGTGISFSATPNADGHTGIIFDASTGGLNAANLATVMSILMDEMDEIDNECYLAYPASQFSQIAGEARFASFDYLQQGVGQDNLTATAMFNKVYGCTPIFIGQNARRRGHGQLGQNATGVNTTAYLYSKKAIGLAIGTTERLGVVEWVPQKRSYLVGAETNAGAARINNGGIVTIKLA